MPLEAFSAIFSKLAWEQPMLERTNSEDKNAFERTFVFICNLSLRLAHTFEEKIEAAQRKFQSMRQSKFSVKKLISFSEDLSLWNSISRKLSRRTDEKSNIKPRLVADFETVAGFAIN
jgi:hypothetical protein